MPPSSFVGTCYDRMSCLLPSAESYLRPPIKEPSKVSLSVFLSTESLSLKLASIIAPACEYGLFEVPFLMP